MDPALYSPLPDDWSIGIADIVELTRAIAEKRYKAVNMAGASVIAAVTNALEGREFPFVFGGDGASFAVSPDDFDRAREALAATAIWVEESLGLVMRVALVPVEAVRAQGLDVRVARFGPSANLSYAMFSGGGLGWAEAAMKRGEFAVPEAAPGTQPDLTGLSCRFEEIPSVRGLILSVLVVPAQGADPAAFRKLIEDVIALSERSPDAGRPVPPGGPPLRWPPAGVEYEARASARRFAVQAARVRAGAYAVRLCDHALQYLRRRFRAENLCAAGGGEFRLPQIRRRTAHDPRLHAGIGAALTQRLAVAASAGIARYGLHRQDAAMMTCFTPSALRSDHVHFIDGARGGYASAATALKAMAA